MRTSGFELKPKEYAARRGWTIAMQIREIGSGAVERQAREQLIEAARRREIDVVLVWPPPRHLIPCQDSRSANCHRSAEWTFVPSSSAFPNRPYPHFTPGGVRSRLLPAWSFRRPGCNLHPSAPAVARRLAMRTSPDSTSTPQRRPLRFTRWPILLTWVARTII
jgi:hypothetical protein